MEEDVKQLSDYSLEELQEEIDRLYVLYQSCKDKADRKTIRNKYSELTTHYNDVVKFKAYLTHL